MYQTESGRTPFESWLKGLDQSLRVKVVGRLERLKHGNLGNCKAVGGVFELKMEVGGGIRIYFGFFGEAVVLLLCGGNKSTQKADIKKAKMYWDDWTWRNRK